MNLCLKMQKKLKSGVLAFLLVGYKCIREASSELCFSAVVDFVRCTNSLLKEFVDGEHFVIYTCMITTGFSFC